MSPASLDRSVREPILNRTMTSDQNRLRIVPTPATEPDKYAWDYGVTADNGRTYPIAVIVTGTDLHTDPEYLPERIAEVMRSEGRSEVERVADSVAAFESIEVRTHRPDLPILRERKTT
jgi:hypothetical protein